jgi:glycosyltransferase involved in cell wall biosynthesis
MKLGLFFTNNVSLKIWQETGNLDREVKPYKRLLNYFEKIYFLTYGKDKEKLKDIEILPAGIFNKEFKSIDVFKTNQLNGSWRAVLVKNIYKKKLVVRQGYQWSIFARKKKLAKWRILIADLTERFAYANADAIMVSSKADCEYIIKRYNVDPEKVNYIPNYIDTDLFKPLEIEKENRICCVAKLEKQKNLENLIEAVRGLDIELAIFGRGSLDSELKKIIPDNVKILNNIANNDLPKEINKSKLFILPSNFEGCPKALLEAMSCGVPVIATNVYGIKEIIKHKENGYLCDTSSDSIRSAIKDLLNDKDLQEKISQNARETVCQNFSLEEMLDKEIKIYDKILAS